MALHERLLGDIPCEGSGREKSPTVILGKLAGSVTTGSESEDISRVKGVVDSTVEREKVILVAIHQVARISGLTRIEVHLVSDVEISD